ncbi:GntR family transcriptional regulator [Ruegeria sp. PrR005]|uniref:FCD domain-containing protein n=1 Tax=Ruegeria sp. PrR005 TaxID=2706882 RepID=A0A6B2NMY6_9RHOB|nr:FCD domain-containing protein [Ruegeria sp. PrR005]NDW43877.1 FCD domain-containing protein [Ruegeria sp. PrR005]
MLAPDRNNDSREGAAGKTAIEEVHAEIRKGILTGLLEPESRLRVEALRKEYGVGSSTVREALSRLLIENLVTTEGQRGFHVAPVSLADFRQIAELRMLLEAQAVTDSIRDGDDDWEARVVGAHHRLAKIETEMPGKERSSVDEWERRNRDFHDALVSACGNRWLLNFRDILYNHSVRYLRISVTERTIPRDVRSEHQAIFNAVIDRDVELAEKLTRDHIWRTVPEIEARLAPIAAAE